MPRGGEGGRKKKRGEGRPFRGSSFPSSSSVVIPYRMSRKKRGVGKKGKRKGNVRMYAANTILNTVFPSLARRRLPERGGGKRNSAEKGGGGETFSSAMFWYVISWLAFARGKNTKKREKRCRKERGRGEPDHPRDPAKIFIPTFGWSFCTESPTTRPDQREEEKGRKKSVGKEKKRKGRTLARGVHHV